MRTKWRGAAALGTVLAAAALAALFAGAARAGTHVQPVTSRGSTTLTTTPVSPAPALTSREFPSFVIGDAGDGGTPGSSIGSGPASGGNVFGQPGGRSDGGNGVHGTGPPPRWGPPGRHDRHAPPAPSVPTVQSSDVVAGGAASGFDGVNAFDQRYANSGNQFSVEPPDQGLCVGGGFVVEAVNDVIGVYTTTGTPLKMEDLNSFYGYPAQYDRATGAQGPGVTDPSCLYDAQSGKFIVDALTYEVDANGNPTGANHIDLAVSQSGDPTGGWNLYSFDVSDDGSNGQPVHPNCPCLGDYPHVGIDQYGYYVTTNEYPWFVDGFNGAQVYAISKAQLTGGAVALNVVHLDELTVAGNPAFTVWPANANPSDWDHGAGGTEYFLSSMATPEANNATGIDNRIAVWSLRGTKSLDQSHERVDLSYDLVRTDSYAIPPQATQKVGDVPLADCLNDRTPIFSDGAGNTYDCSQALLNGSDDPFTEVEGTLDSLDSRMQQVWLVNGTLIGALGTAVNVHGDSTERAGIAWFAFDPSRGRARLIDQGYLAVANNNLTMPAIATLPNGRGAMAFTLTGTDWYPSAGYARISVGSGRGGGQNGFRSRSSHGGNDSGGDNRGRNASGGVQVGQPQVAAPGAGPQDGFSEYRAFSPTGDGVARPRWGDYGAAVSDGSSLWVASEYIPQTCTYADWLGSGFTCGGTRGAVINWGTRISQVSP